MRAAPPCRMQLRPGPGRLPGPGTGDADYLGGPPPAPGTRPGSQRLSRATPGRTRTGASVETPGRDRPGGRHRTGGPATHTAPPQCPSPDRPEFSTGRLCCPVDAPLHHGTDTTAPIPRHRYHGTDTMAPIPWHRYHGTDTTVLDKMYDKVLHAIPPVCTPPPRRKENINPGREVYHSCSPEPPVPRQARLRNRSWGHAGGPAQLRRIVRSVPARAQ